MSKPMFELNAKAVAEMLRSAQAQAIVSSAASSIARRAGDGFAVEPRTKSRARAYVKPTTTMARKAAADHALEIAAMNGV